MKIGDKVKINHSTHPDVRTGMVGEISSLHSGGYGVKIEAEYQTATAVPSRIKQVREIWFPREYLRVIESTNQTVKDSANKHPKGLAGQKNERP